MKFTRKTYSKAIKESMDLEIFFFHMSNEHKHKKQFEFTNKLFARQQREGKGWKIFT